MIPQLNSKITSIKTIEILLLSGHWFDSDRSHKSFVLKMPSSLNFLKKCQF